jgi:hypothetical protein
MGESFQPLAVVTTLQPILVAWLAAISFFVTLAAVAILSKGRKWYELACLFFVVFVVLSSSGIAISNWVLEVTVLEVEVISMGSP